MATLSPSPASLHSYRMLLLVLAILFVLLLAFFSAHGYGLTGAGAIPQSSSAASLSSQPSAVPVARQSSRASSVHTRMLPLPRPVSSSTASQSVSSPLPSTFTYRSSASQFSAQISSGAMPLIADSVSSSCSALDFTATTRTHYEQDQLVGTLIFTNQTTRSCSFSGYPQLTIFDVQGNTFAAIARREATAQAVAVRVGPGSAMQVAFRWNNWCGMTTPAGPLSVKIRFGTSDYLSAPLLTSYGARLSDAPACDQPQNDSLLILKPFTLT